MPISIEEFESGAEHAKRAFGTSSETRKAIIAYLKENGAATPKEVGTECKITPKQAKTVMDVMRRDGLVTWKDVNEITYYALTVKGKNRE